MNETIGLIGATAKRVADEYRASKKRLTIASLKAIVSTRTNIQASITDKVVSAWYNDTEHNGGYYPKKGPAGGLMNVADEPLKTAEADESAGKCCPLCDTGVRDSRAHAIIEALNDPMNKDLKELLVARGEKLRARISMRTKQIAKDGPDPLIPYEEDEQEGPEGPATDECPVEGAYGPS